MPKYSNEYKQGYCNSYKMTCWAMEDKPVCTCAQSDYSHHCLHEEALCPWLSIPCTVRTDQTIVMHRLIGVFAEHTCNLVGNAMPWLIYDNKLHLMVFHFLKRGRRRRYVCNLGK